MDGMTTTPPELPPAHTDTPQQKAALRGNKVAARVRKMFPRGTRVEATGSFDEPGNGLFGTVVAHIPGRSADGGRVTVLWDAPKPFGTGLNVTRGIWAGSLLVVDPETGRGIVRPGIESLFRREA